MRLRKSLALLALGWSACFAGAAPAASSERAPSPLPEALAAYRGQVTYVDFWASWCGPCAESFPWLNALQAQYAAQGLRVVGIGVDEDAGNAARFLKRHPAQFALIADPQGQLAEKLAVEGMPYGLLFGRDGKVLYRHTGFRADEAAETERRIQAALATSGVHP